MNEISTVGQDFAVEYTDIRDALPPSHDKPLDDKLRAGYTTNKGNGESKARRKMAKASRKRNRL